MMIIEKIERPDPKVLEDVLVASKDIFSGTIYSSLRPGYFPYLRKKFIKKFASNPDCTLYITRQNGAIRGVAFFVYLGWDTGIFGFKIGRIEQFFLQMSDDLNYEFIGKIIADCKAREYAHVVVRAGLKDHPALSALERNGFTVADMQLTLSTPEEFHDNAVNGHAEICSIDEATKDDLPQLQAIVAGVFTDTRFVIDPHYPRNKVDAMYGEWIRDAFSVLKERIFVAQDRMSKRLLGFIICGVDDDSEDAIGIKVGFVDLVAVATDRRGKGLGSMLVRYALAWFASKKMDKVEIRTQVSNVAAIRAFMRSGFSQIDSGITLQPGVTMHGWFKEAGQ